MCAVELYTLASEQGDADSQYNLGCMYNDGQGVDKDEKQAVKLFTLAADQGHAKAQYNVGCIIANGQSLNQPYTQAREWLAKAAAQGYPRYVQTKSIQKNNAGIGGLTELDEAVDLDQMLEMHRRSLGLPRESVPMMSYGGFRTGLL